MELQVPTHYHTYVRKYLPSTAILNVSVCLSQASKRFFYSLRSMDLCAFSYLMIRIKLRTFTTWCKICIRQRNLLYFILGWYYTWYAFCIVPVPEPVL